ncbi:unnamed protein product [Cylicocyclus nassatus]|uniref:Uncharacterized protein n=1 Tax=Cylicocyclus nassatus TaxID=53992 RepID=A0AA36DU05_CYLNA|nr:unnamed protein product [Cylicocyclus nassatus]
MLLCILILLLVCSTFLDSGDPKFCRIKYTDWVKALKEKLEEGCVYKRKLEYQDWMESTVFLYGTGKWAPDSSKYRIFKISDNPCDQEFDKLKEIAGKMRKQIDADNLRPPSRMTTCDVSKI